MTDTDRETLLRNYEDAKASCEIAGFNFSDEHDALFHHMIKLGLDEEASNKMIDAYLAGELDTSLQAAAE